MKKILTLSAIALLTLNTNVANANWEKPTLVYGSGLSASQKEEVTDLLGTSESKVNQKVTTSKDVETYLNVSGTSNSNLYSSTLVTKTNKTGVDVNIKTPNNITKITEKQYANAAITAGAKNVTIDVASPIKVTGESALTGVYIALESNGEKLDKKRTLVAQQELETVNEIAVANQGKGTFNNESLDLAVTEVKEELAKHKGKATEETVRNIVNTSLKSNGISDVVTQEQIDKLVTFAKSYQETDAISSEEVAKQLNTFKDETKKYISENYGGLWEKTKTAVGDFFESIWKAISNIFS
ncbi:MULTISPECIES: DUF1002 domain-containing protein [unclassified Gemella]|uniref:DUF1002 domain-containing protein n=1 Tax=unclassified Gemella TaxID=2624949 RepID=UPI001073226D|nr:MULTISPECIES: DUF1002 domain-containing protein [unclassified Gemella]MBF0710477.1 DUF1002 domain-containing protein [Gemella sp. GL1.1]MBF0746581.1 DUF1002 domain-containing protein [Gemella sp. 19428wG2_WT2a]NYS27821.1 DUF1002 domain-containing protein [Gemella sp. GL1]TFU59941.1 DUF1002 domain-containing protein [Gemella sp. WT2a]